MTKTEPGGVARLEYTGKMILAPMVKVGTLPMRMLALQYGADIVYSEEIIDKRLLASDRIVNSALGTVDYIDRRDNSLVLRICPEERSRLVVQIGTCDGDRAAATARKLEQDIAGIDVNMGCPKSFSLKGGMGAALLSRPEKVRDILTKLVSAVGEKISVTCKIRLLPDWQDTLDLVSLIETTGVAALAVHGRTKEQRPNDPNDTAAIRKIVEHTKLPIIANGGSSNNRNSAINTYSGIREFWTQSGAASVMVARAAEWNPSVFRKEGKEDIMVVIGRYLSLTIHYDYPFNIAKYVLQQLLGSMQDSDMGRKFLDCATLGDLAAWGDKKEEWEKRQLELENLGDSRPDIQFSNKVSKEGKDVCRKRKLEDGGEITEMFLPFVRGHFGNNESSRLPKTLLHLYALQNGYGQPLYEVDTVDKQFRATVKVGANVYSSLVLEKNKKYAEQSAALVAVKCLDITEKTIVWKDKSKDISCNCKDGSPEISQPDSVTTESVGKT